MIPPVRPDPRHLCHHPDPTTVGPPNDQLRTARRRTASLTHPDECLTRQELAELVNT
ncbi:MAG: hypothetical protein JO063_00060 [Pseudonocardiales bacterium]|nr:hypothetical protein [Pseudonocardiales bacterium]